MRYRGYRKLSLNPILVIIAVNVLVFIAAQISIKVVAYLGLRSGEAFFNYPWGIVTSIFVHYEFFHIFANMLTLYFFGSYLHRVIGGRRFSLIYLGGGILGSLFFILLAPPSYLAIGASGAVFAIGGVLSILRPNLKVFIFPTPAPLSIWVAVIGGFVILSLFPPIAWQAHLGGLVFGLTVGYSLKKRMRYYF